MVVHLHSDDFFGRPAVSMYCKADTNYSLSIRNDQVILAHSNPTDPLQHWIRDDRYSTRARDAEGFPSFALINKATGQALKHAIGAAHPVQLVQYNPNVLDESVLWSDKELGDGYRAIRMWNNTRLNIDIFKGNLLNGGVHDGSIVGLWEWNKGDNQRWNMMDHNHHPPAVKIYCKTDTYYCLSIRCDQVILAHSNPSDPFQHWIRDDMYGTRVRDAQGFPSFALINKVTGQALKHAMGASPVQLAQYNPNVFDESVLWSDKELDDGYRAIRMWNNIRLNIDAFKCHGGVHDGSIVVLWEWNRGDNQRWKIMDHNHPLTPPPHHRPPPPPVDVFPPPPPRVEIGDHHHHTPPLPHHSDDIFGRPSVKIYCKADTNYSLSIRHGKVILALSNASDPLQHWIRDDRYSTSVRDAQGLPSFALINKVTGQALKHAMGAKPIQLVQYNPDVLDKSILWSEKELDDGYKAVRMWNNIKLNIDAFKGNFLNGGVHDGSIVCLWKWNNGDNQRWEIIHHCKIN